MIDYMLAVISLATALLVVWAGMQSARAIKTASEAAAIAQRTDDRVQQLAITVNGRLTQLIETTRQASFGEGKAEGLATRPDDAATPST